MRLSCQEHMLIANINLTAMFVAKRRMFLNVSVDKRIYLFLAVTSLHICHSVCSEKISYFFTSDEYDFYF